MANVAMLIGGAFANALAFTGCSYLFDRLSADNIDVERKRHDAAIEALQKAQIEWTHKCQQRIDFINELPPLPREPVLSDFYTLSDEQHYRELGFIALSMIGIGGVLYYFQS